MVCTSRSVRSSPISEPRPIAWQQQRSGLAVHRPVPMYLRLVTYRKCATTSTKIRGVVARMGSTGGGGGCEDDDSAPPSHSGDQVAARSSTPDEDANNLDNDVQKHKHWSLNISESNQILIATSAAFVLCNMDKVNISIAVIPMAKDFGWSPSTIGLIQSSFFYGYLLSQIPGGYAANRWGGRRVLPWGVGIWSLATASVPLLASTLFGLCVSRAAVGLGEGIAPSAATDIVARAIDPRNRSRAISIIFGGLHVGSLLGLTIAPIIITQWNWQAVFFLFGGAGFIWVWWWEKLVRRAVANDKVFAHAFASSRAPSKASAEEYIPWRAFFRNQAVQALGYTHFCNNWFHYTMLAWLPYYFSDLLSLDLRSAAGISLLPPLAAVFVSAIAGPLADYLIDRKRLKVSLVRKAAQCAAFLGPAGCLLAVSTTELDGNLTVALLSLSLGLASFSLAGLYSNHADLSPRYASILLGLTNTAGAIPGIAGVAFTGWLYDSTNSWGIALFSPSIFFFITGSLVYVLYGSSDEQNFMGSEANRRFPLEWEEIKKRIS